MNALYKKVKALVTKFEKIAIKRGWNVKKTIILEKATIEEIDIVEEKIGKKLPNELKEVLLNFTKNFDFCYFIEGEKPPKEFNEIFSAELDWDLNGLIASHQYFLDWMEASLDTRSNDLEAIKITKKIGFNKTPLLEIGNGDLIVIDDSNNEVIYLNHEGGIMHGKRLEKSFFAYLEKIAKIGFICGEQLEQLYDFENQCLLETNHPKVEKWLAWLEKN
jgi:hypothetical protein